MTRTVAIEDQDGPLVWVGVDDVCLTLWPGPDRTPAPCGHRAADHDDDGCTRCGCGHYRTEGASE